MTVAEMKKALARKQRDRAREEEYLAEAQREFENVQQRIGSADTASSDSAKHLGAHSAASRRLEALREPCQAQITLGHCVLKHGEPDPMEQNAMRTRSLLAEVEELLRRSREERS